MSLNLFAPMRVRLMVITLLAAVLTGCSPSGSPPAAALPTGCIADPPAVIGGPIDLVDASGGAVTQARFAGRPALVYFGFSYCPDICPLSLQTARATLESLGEAGAEIQPVLITLDPERDTPEQIGRYAATDVFPEGTVGLTGTVEQTTAAAQAFRVAWRKSELSGSAAEYLIDHSSFFYLMSGDWRTLVMYPSSLPPADAARCLQAGLENLSVTSLR